MGKYYGEFARQYKGDNPSKFRALINKLSFHCANMSDGKTTVSLSGYTPDGKVTVLRTPEVEYVKVTSMGGGIEIILSSAQNETYGIPFSLSNENVKIVERKKRINLPAAFFGETFIDPNYDKRAETCPFIYTLDHKNFIVVINGGNMFQAVAKARDDWHYNFYVNDPTLSLGQHFLTYYECCTRRMVSDSHVAYSFSPFTFAAVQTHISRYIDHAKRMYIPILGRGSGFEGKHLKISKCEGSPFGKKPFTIVLASDEHPDGISTYREVVKVSGVISLDDPYNFRLLVFWPFTPYLREISYLNLQWLSLFYGELPLMASLQEINSFCNYKMEYYPDENGAQSVSLRSDIAEGTFPEVTAESSESSSINLGIGKVDGESRVEATQSVVNTVNIKKSASIGTVGGLKDLFVETELNGIFTYDYSLLSVLTRNSNFPAVYYLAEFVDQWNVWPCDMGFADATDAEEEMSAKYTNEITGTQVLKVGGIIIDSGAISMKFESEDRSLIRQSGTASFSKPCTPCASIGYTSQQMSVGGTQSLTCLDGDGNEIDIVNSGCTWEITSGGGSITQDGVYTAPTTNPECANNPVISLMCGGAVVDTLAIAIAVNVAGVAAWQCDDLGAPWTGYHCYGIMNCLGLWDCGFGYGIDCNTIPPCTTHTGFAANSCASMGMSIGFTDQRSAAMKTAGCCPEEFL